MVKTRNKFVVLLAVIALAFLSCGVALYLGTARAWQGTLSSETSAVLQDNYVVGEKLVIPTGVIEYKGQTYQAEEVVLYTPTNKALRVTEYTFDKAGNYKLVYTAKVDQKFVNAEKDITVNVLSYGGDKTKVESVDYLASLSQTKSSSEKTAGLKVNVPMADVFTWNTPIDLNEMGLDTAFLSFLPYQYSMASKGEDGNVVAHVSNIFVRLTDAYDAGKYIEVKLEYLDTAQSSALNQLPSYSAGAYNQPKQALDTNVGRDARDGTVKTFYDADLTNGQPSIDYYVTWEEFNGYPNKGDLTEKGALIGLYYDVKTQQVRVSQQSTSTVYDRELINDLDTKTNYPTNAFTGFTTGEVYLSIYGVEFVNHKNSFDMDIASIGGVSGKDLAMDYAKDEKAPIIEVEISDEQVKNGIYVAQSVPVTLMSAVAYDVNLVELKTQVTYHGQNVTVSGNTFVPTSLGEYLVTYIAKDTVGNISTKEYVFNCVSKADNANKLISVELNADQLPSQIPAGKPLTLPEFAITSPNGFVNVNLFAYVKGNMSNKIAIDLENPVINVENVGEYVVVFEYSDLFEEGVSEYSFKTASSDEVVWATPKLPKYFIKDALYTLDAVYAKTFTSSEPKLEEATYQISQDGAAFTSVDYSDFKVTANNTVQFKYTHAGKSFTSEVLPVINVNFTERDLDVPKYFQGDVAIEDYGTSSFAVLANKTSGNATVDFINPISLVSLELNFTFPKTMSNVKAVAFVFTDYNNPEKSVAVEYAQDGTGFLVTVSNGSRGGAKKMFNDTTYNLKYSVANNCFTDVNLASTLPWQNVFEGDRVLLSIEFRGITGKAGMVFNSMNGVTIAKAVRDNYSPYIGYDTTFQGKQTVNTIATLSKAEGSDLFCPTYYGNYNIKLTVIDVEGNTVSDINNQPIESVDAIQDFQLVLKTIGEYIVTYSYRDQKSKSNIIYGFYSINVVDSVKPSITVDGIYDDHAVITASLGDVITAKNYKATDNFDTSAELVVNVVVFDPFNNMHDLIDNGCEIDDMKFVCEYRGVYTVYYYAEDSSGNITTLSYKVFVG